MTLKSRSVAVALAVLLAAPVAAEVPKPPEASRVKTTVYQMRSGNIRVKDDPKNREALKTVAEWLAFTLCQPPYNGETPPASDRTPIGVDRSPAGIMSDAKSLSDI